MRGTDFYLPLGGQPSISERKSWRAPIVTEQGNPGIYVQIDEWLPIIQREYICGRRSDWQNVSCKGGAPHADRGDS